MDSVIHQATYCADDGTAVRVDATVLEPPPKFLSVLGGINVSWSLEHQELSKKLIRVGDYILGVLAFSKFLDGGGANTWDFGQFSGSSGALPELHSVVRDLGAVWVVSFVLGL